MDIRRVVPNIKSRHPDASRAFYVDFLGFKVGMDMGFILTVVSPTNPAAQVSILRDDAGPAPGSAAPHAQMTVEVGDVDEVHSRAVARGLEIVYPLTDEAWGVRRFAVVDPDGLVLNIMSHRSG